jgi:hypothetical protein
MQIQGDMGLITWIPSATQAGSHTVTVRVSDGRGGIRSQSFTLEIADAINTAPVITSTTPKTVITESAVYSYDAQATDGDNDSLTYSLLESPTGMTMDPVTGLINWVPAHEQIGVHEVTVQVQDGRGGSDTQTFTLIVEEINFPPQITSSPVLNGEEGVPYYYDVAASDANVGSVLSFALTAKPEGMTIDSETGLITWTPLATQGGSYTVTIQVSDSRGGANSQGFTLDIADTINVAPVITSSTPTTVITEGEAYTYDVEATDGDNDTLTYLLGAAPSGMTVDSTTGLVSWTPAHEQTGDHQVAIQVEDGRGGTDSQSFTLTVEEINFPPQITSSPVTEGAEGQLYSYDVVGSSSRNIRCHHQGR